MKAPAFGGWALVTGASDGIGRAVAEQLAAQQVPLVLVARREAALQDLAQQLRSAHGVQVQVMAMDLAAPGASEQLFARTETLDIGLLVAAAGFGSSGPLLDGDLANEQTQLQLNCGAVLAQCRLFGPRLVARGGGGLMLFSSVVAFQGAANSANYAATKAYVQSLAEGLHLELKPRGVAVLAVAPGPVQTGFATRAGLHMAQALQPAVIARQSLAAMGRQGTVRPGWLSKLLGWSLAMLPRWGRVRVMSAVMQGMRP